jgi:hypothetical protein
MLKKIIKKIKNNFYYTDGAFATVSSVETGSFCLTDSFCSACSSVATTLFFLLHLFHLLHLL